MDPLSPNNITPSWSTSPPRFRSALPYLSPARTRPKSNQPTSPAPTIPASSPFREPKVFGAPGLSLPASSSGSGDNGASGSQSPRKDKGREGGFVRVRIGVLERNRKDLLIRFDANVCVVSCKMNERKERGLTIRRIYRTLGRGRIGICRDHMSNSSDSQNRSK